MNFLILQHRLGVGQFTLCGIPIALWSRAYQARSIPEILCKRCAMLTPPGPARRRRK